MTSSQSSGFTKAIFVLFFLVFLSTFTAAIPLSGRSTTTRTELPCISTCLSDLSVSATSVCKDGTMDDDKCLCAMVTSVAPKAFFANCVESCSQGERNRLKGICGAGHGGSNDGEKKAVAGIQESGPTNFASTSGKDDDDGDDNGSDSADDNDDDDDDNKPKKTPDVPVRKNNSTNTDDTTNTSNTSNTSDGKNQDKKGDASLNGIHPVWTAIGAVVITMILAI